MSKTRRIIGGLLIAFGFAVFPVLWVVFLAAYSNEYPELMRFLGRSDAHVFFNLPGTLRAFEILFAALPAFGATLIATGVFLLRGRGAIWSWFAGLGVGFVTLIVAVIITP
ncbi:MAG: hypothetical protein ACR2N7_07720 [Acidimicrobiia bacterium]